MRKSLLLFALLFIGLQATLATVSIHVCGPDEQTPFGFHKIMVGQELTLIVSVDPNDYWSGGLFIEDDDRAIGGLEGRDSDPNVRDFTDSHYPAAGDYADVWAWNDSEIWGFDMYSSDSNCVAGDWFIIDYAAKEPGQCQVDFYDYNTSWTITDTVFNLEQVPSCDFNNDGTVDFNDFSQIATYWLIEDCNDVNDCIAVDLDFDSIVDHNDLAIFSEFWLWDGGVREPEPNIPPIPDPTPDPNIIYSVVDANGLDEIYLDPNESITLYVDLTTTGPNSIRSFYVEVQISDPNIGSINNTADPNGTADIIAYGSNVMFDHWGPGISQPEGIVLQGYTMSLTDPIIDGHLASFVYTANGTGDVTLNVVNISSEDMKSNAIYPSVESILIHQLDP